ncbi:hypothetical protein [Halorussus marinus]|uniref:hypothetical protein n=1 Tax=Halorussus marinus TaxID=2505976 RepID=UPI00106E8FD1|nr:hypothetical protein [Halorussus marinus]
MSVARAWLTEIRTNRRERWFALAAAAVIAVGAAQIHWYGFLVGGALVGAVSKTLSRAVAAGLGVGLLSWGVFAATVAANGAFSQYAATGQAFGLSVAIPVVAAGIGSLVRGVV